MTAKVTLQPNVPADTPLEVRAETEGARASDPVTTPGSLIYKWTGLKPGMIYQVDATKPKAFYGVTGFAVTQPGGKYSKHLTALPHRLTS